MNFNNFVGWEEWVSLPELNSSPGLQGIENTNNINVASLIIDYLEKRLGLSKFAK